MELPAVAFGRSFAALAAGGASARRRVVVEPEPAEEVRAAASAHEDALEAARARDRVDDARVEQRARQAGARAHDAAPLEPRSAPRPRSKYLERHRP